MAGRRPRPRNDSLGNIFTGMGGASDPQNGLYLDRRYHYLSARILDDLVRDFPLLRKIVETFPDMMTARFGVPVFGGEAADQPLLEKLKAKLTRLKGYSRFNEYRGVADCFNTLAKFANLYGNGGAIMICDDAEDYSTPINFRKLRTVTGLYILNNEEIYPDIGRSNYLNQFTHFVTRSWVENKISQNLVHKSRVLWFRGTELGAESLAANNGKDDSILTGLLDNFFAYKTGLLSLNRMITNSSQKRHGINGLYEEMAEKGEEYEQFVINRLQLNERSSSVFNTFLYDPEKESIDFLERGNLADVNEAFQNVLTDLIANTKYTKSQLLGEFVGGILTAGSETERQQINMAVLQAQRAQLHPQILKLIETIVRSAEFGNADPDRVGLDWHWLPYSLPTSAELATLKNQYVSMALSANSIDPKIAINMLLSFFAGSEFSEEVTLLPEVVEALRNTILSEAKEIIQETDPIVNPPIEFLL